MCGLDDEMDATVATYRPGCLLVDDREENLFAHEALLQDTGAWICKARSGDEALELLLQHDFAVALIDVQMPGMDGLELAELMRGIERTRRVPIIFVTAARHDESTVLRGYANGGAVDFLYKPLSPAVVKRKVGVFLEMAQHERALKTNLERIQRSLTEAEASRRAMEKAHELRDHLLAIAGHDLRTPLTAIVGTARLIEERPEDPAIARRIALIVRSAERMAEIIEEMVELSRAHQAGGFPIQRGEVDLAELCRGVIAEIQVVHPDHAITLAAPGELSGRWDARALAQALSNLVTNAVVHGAGSPVTVTLGASGDDAVVEVHNAGPTIPGHLIPQLFEPYRHGPSQPGSKGLGLGLFIVREVVRAHGGAIAVRSTASEGTCFAVRLPRA